ncbi:MAG: prepilin-type N-terminal cleavage/methylation domain-containing protein [Amoebophilaceae bacterium]|nr:prepilin-type N-terminal cleavage/methylation domain-containing protein [Amoebophilaceae bacterium]
MKIKKLNKNLGFSLVELTVTLAVFGVIVLITTQIIEQVNVKKILTFKKSTSQLMKML